MAMRLIRGAPGCGKTALVFREFSEAVQAGEGADRKLLRIVVPTATLVRHYQHELARSGLVFDPGMVVSLSRFAHECAPPERALPLVSPGLFRALVRASLQRLVLPEFADVANTGGMADVVVDTISIFENAGCTPDQLQARSRHLSARGKAFHRIWKDVDDALAARGFATRGRIFRIAAAAALSGRVWIDGFLNFSAVERGLVKNVASTCDLTMTLSDGPMTSGTAKFDLRRFAMELGTSDQLLTGSPRHPQVIAVRAATPEREADDIARRILALHGQGIGFPEIAVALRDVDAWLPLLRSVFDRFGIPARYYFTASARRHPVAAFLGGLLECACGGWDFAQTLAALRANPQWGHSADFDRFDYAVRETMPARGAEELLRLCESERCKSIWLREKIAECLSIEKWRHESAPPAVWHRRLTRFAEHLYRLRTLPEPADYSAIETARSHAAGLRAFSSALEVAAFFFSADDSSVSFERFCAAVSSALDDAVMQIPDDRRDVVHVLSAFEARQWEVRALFICGMTARDYPRFRAPNLLFPDADLERLRNAGIPLLTAADADRDEELLFDVLKTRASETLVLSVSARDSGGRTALPSAHFANTAIVESAPQCRPAATHLFQPAGEVHIPSRIGVASLAALAVRHERVSITALEDLARCHFRFFAGRTLKLTGPPDRPADRLQARVRGSIFHKAMEEWLLDRARDFVEIFEATFDRFCHQFNFPRGYSLEVERILCRRIARQVNESVRWPAISSELETDCSFTLAASGFPAGVTVTCRVDRIDHLGDGNCVIVDYKSGKVENVDKLLTSQTSLQGPLYALAVRERKQLNAVAMLFLAIREDKPIGWGTIPGGGDMGLLPMPLDWIDSARIRTETRLAELFAGDVHVEPTGPEDCKWCDFKNCCRVEQQEAELIPLKTEVAGGN